jgi:hypothetical protein
VLLDAAVETDVGVGIEVGAATVIVPNICFVCQLVLVHAKGKTPYSLNV